MALQNYGGTSYYSASVVLYSNTGFTVDHLPGNYASIPNSRIAVTNADARLMTLFGIGVLRVAMPAIGADAIDYCIVSPKIRYNRQPSGTDVSVGSGFSPAVGTQWNTAGKNAYYFITGHGERNGGVVVFTVMLDCYTTLVANGYKFSDLGGMLTRIPANLLYEGTYASGVRTQFNTFVEPFTTSFRMLHKIKAIRPQLFSTDDQQFRNLRLVLSPYSLSSSDEVTTVETISGSSDSTYTESDGKTASTNKGTNTKTYYKATSAGTTNFRVGSTAANAVTGNYGVAAFPDSDAVKERVAQLYAAGISNAIYDAYTILSPTTEQESGKYSSISGVDSSLEVQLEEGVPFYKSKKNSYYNRYITLISLSSGQSQTVDYVDAVISEGPTLASQIRIDIASDPSPNGCVYMRIRKNTEEIPDNAVAAMLPGHVCGTTWRKLGIALTQNGQGVELGQAWRSAELDIDARTAELNADATTAQYDMSVGNGYILKNAGNVFAIRQIGEAQRYAAQSSDTQRSQNILKNALNTAQSAINYSQSDKPTLIGGTVNVISAGISGFVDVMNNMETSTQSLENLGRQSDITMDQLYGGGQYNQQLLRAQSAAASQVAQASIDKVELQRTKLQDFPSIPILSSESRGILNGTADQFILIESYMDERDRTRFDSMLLNFGQATYTDPADVSDENGNPLTPNDGWANFYKLDAPGKNWNQNNDFPSWIVKGAYDQLSAGVWFYNYS